MIKNLVMFKVGWLACVAGAAAGFAWLGAVVVAAVVLEHLRTAPQPGREVWLLAAAGMRKPGRHASRLLQLQVMSAEQAELAAAGLRDIRGVLEAVVVGEEGVAYLKIDRNSLDDADLDAFVQDAFVGAQA